MNKKIFKTSSGFIKTFYHDGLTIVAEVTESTRNSAWAMVKIGQQIADQCTPSEAHALAELASKKVAS